MLALAACAPPHPHPRPAPRTISRLDCPTTPDGLTLQSAAADGRSCVYKADGGDQVTLQLVDLAGKDPATALAPLEASLKAELPAAAAAAAAPPSGAASAWDANSAPNRDKADIDLPGLHIHTDASGRAKVDVAGVHVDAQDGADHRGDRATVQVGDGAHGVHVEANDGGAQIRISEKGLGYRARYVLVSEQPGPHGWRIGSYLARGPDAGPLAVAVLLGKSKDEDELHDEMAELLRRNVGR
jgi:hypothetical protein